MNINVEDLTNIPMAPGEDIQHYFSFKSLSTKHHHCGLGVTSLLLTQRARVRSPVGLVSWLKFFRGFPSTVRQISGNFGEIRPRLSYDHHMQGDSVKVCKNVTGHRGCSTEQF